jgi:hypothetical protein
VISIPPSMHRQLPMLALSGADLEGSASNGPGLAQLGDGRLGLGGLGGTSLHTLSNGECHFAAKVTAAAFALVLGEPEGPHHTG